jgi:hypothetical protein
LLVPHLLSTVKAVNAVYRIVVTTLMIYTVVKSFKEKAGR